MGHGAETNHRRKPNQRSLRHLGAELRKHLGYLVDQIRTVRAGEGAKVLTVPAPLAVLTGGGAARQGRHLGREVRVEEERERQPLVAAEVAYAVRGRPIPAA